MYAKSQGYIIFKEIAPPPETVLMKRARRGQPPATQKYEDFHPQQYEELYHILEVIYNYKNINSSHMKRAK
ncbi:hypothetical protein AXF42_Ash018991 [Apostasia shenzhenica]|uniref:Uncharacterized protein n=1 Tax=Apostasia shenzhenica TaxID=1088818 RepID=A0A2I0AC08_9ASPA|nr:hypothetical protein AXF42_Ash018991 [Apostasia shenzhenica]